MADLKITPELKEAFINMLAELPNITVVSKLFGVDPSNIHRARKSDVAFDEKVASAIEQGYDLYEEEARRRAIDGVLKPVFYKGEKCGDIREYSDNLLQTILKAYRPKRFNPGAKLSIGDGESISLTLNIGGD